MQKKFVDRGPIAYMVGLVLGYVIGKYLPEETTRRQDIGVGLVVFFTPLIWSSGPKNEDKEN